MPTDIAAGVPSGVPLSVDQWGELPDDVPGELVDGMLVEEEMTNYIHESVVSFLIEAFRRWVRPRGGFVGGSEAKFAVSEGRGRKPDLSVYLPGDPPPEGKAPVLHVPPGLLVEVVSPRPRDARRDRVDKLDEYARFGVRYYWILDPQLRTLEVYERGPDGRYVRALSATAGSLDAVPGCPGLRLDLDALWAEVQELEGAGGEEDPG